MITVSAIKESIKLDG